MSLVSGNMINGEYKRWYFNGRLWIHTFYKDGERNGEYKSWHSNGQLGMHQFYKDGELDGESRAWNSNGRPTFHTFYKDGKVFDDSFLDHKKRILLQGFQKLRYKSNVRNIDSILNKNMPVDLVKLFAKYKD